VQLHLSCPHYAGRRVELLRHVDAWRAEMMQRGVVRSRAEAMAWVHTDLGAPRVARAAVTPPACGASCGRLPGVFGVARADTRSSYLSRPLPCALCPCPVLAAAAPALGSALQCPLIPSNPPPPLPRPMVSQCPQQGEYGINMQTNKN
jgi:hypothetical protein